jgi:GT2 family glycosyltransferase
MPDNDGVREITSELFGGARHVKRAKPDMSILIAMAEGHGEIDDIVAALARQTANVDRFEVLVVDDRQDPRNQQHLSKIKPAMAHRIHLRVFTTTRLGRASSNNIAIRHSSAELILFLAADYVPLPDLVTQHLAFHEANPDPRAAGLGPGLFPESIRQDAFCRWLEDSGSLFGVSFTRNMSLPTNFFYCANTSLKRSFLLNAGLFDESFPFDTTDDFELGIRLAQNGVRIFYLPGAIALHHHSVTFEERCEAIRRGGQSAFILEAKHPGSSSRIPIIKSLAQKHRIRVGYYWLRHQLFGRGSHSETYWAKELAAEFATGFESARLQSTTQAQDHHHPGGNHVDTTTI